MGRGRGCGSWVWVWVNVVGKKSMVRLLLRPLPDIFLRHVGLGSPLTPSLPYMLPMEIYTYLSCRRKINETDVSYTYNLQKVGIDSSDWLNGSGCSLLIFTRSTIPYDQRRFLNMMERDHRGKGQGKRTILKYFIFLHRSLS